MKYCWVDLETGGLKPAENPILQIAAIFTNVDYEILGYYMSYIKPSPGLTITEKAMEVNKINLKALENAPTEEVVMTAFRLMLSDDEYVFAGYNAPFDKKFLKHAGVRSSVDFEWAKEYCIMRRIQDKTGSTKYIKQTDACMRYGIPTDNAHDAMADIKMCLSLARNIDLKGDPSKSPRQLQVTQQKLKV